ncbi:MAG: hypothetical protein FWG74_09765, partial [Planctomycetes bacterium]|nr:hypothetical protein [Planctomycetota bacterium]
NAGLSNFQQIFKRDNYQVSIGFNGAIGANVVTAIGDAAMSRQATKAYLEIDAYEGSISEINKHGYLTQGHSFILTGTLGARQFNFSEGAHISEVVNAIKSVAGSTGIDAALIFNREQMINVSTGTPAEVFEDKVGMAATNTCSAIVMYENYTVRDDGTKAVIASSLEGLDPDAVIYGYNTDGQGNIYIKLVDGGAGAAYEIYKDASLSKESLIGTGIGDGTESVEKNNSGLKDIKIDIKDGKYGDVIRVSLGNIVLDDDATAGNVASSGNVRFDLAESTASGVQLGINTDSAGKMYFKVVYEADGCQATVYAYNNALMREQDIVAKTADLIDMTQTGKSIILDSIWNDEKTANTGLGITLVIGGDAVDPDEMGSKTESFEIQFKNLAARVFSSDYGSDQYIKVQTFEGGIFVNYEDAANYDSARLIEKNTTFELRGQDATVTVNGQQMKTTGLTLNLATPDIMANLTFNAGKSGTTTVAQVGYGEGSVFTKATSLTFAYALELDSLTAKTDQGSNYANNEYFTGLLNNACHATQELIQNFQGGMQLQLGEGSGDQERTVIGLKSMSTAQLGRIEVTKQFDPKKAVIETKTLSIQDVMGGQLASLSNDPIIAMKIIDKAIKDVSEARASIGAVQANMLQTNENNLRVAIENITKTESTIRDTDMAAEMTEFTKFQILSQAGVSMLSQANARSQAALQLLQ